MKFGIIGAMTVEVELLKAQMEHPTVTCRAGRTFYEGRLGGVDCVVVVCGVGKVNAALCVQILADCYGVTHIINTGVAGALDARLNIGDIVISTDAMYHDFDVGAFGYHTCQVPGIDVLAFPADEALSQAAENCCKVLGIPCIRGRIASGDQFICDDAAKNRIAANTQAMCTEMEGAAIAHAAYLNGLPALILRAISDKADHSADMDYPTFEKAAAHHCAQMVCSLMETFSAR